MSKLTNTEIKNAKSRDKAYSLSDGLGLSLQINPNKTKYWRFRFQFEGKAKLMSFGTYPDVSLVDARVRREEERKKIAKGTNPITKNQQTGEGGSMVFEAVVKKFLQQLEPKVSEAHYKRSKSLFRLYAIPELQNQRMDEISHKDIKRIIVSLVDAEKVETAKKLHSMFLQVFGYAVDREICEENVVRRIEYQKDFFTNVNKRKSPTITEPAQIKMLMENIREFEGNHHSTKSALLFMAYTSLRSANVRHARWEQIDLEGRTMTIKKEEMKIKKSALAEAEDFKLPLATQTIELLNEIKKITGDGTYIFQSNRGDRPMSENAMLVYIRNLGYTKEQFVPHGFRAMFSTITNANDNGYDRDLIDAQLAHVTGNIVSRTYNRGDLFNRRVPLVQWWADWLDSLSVL